LNYRTIKKTGEKVSLLGFGAMRLPFLDGDFDKVNETEAVRMIRTAIDRGVNYVDTAYVYHGGNSEVAVGKALKDGYREKVLIADKLPIWLAKTEDDIQRLFDTQLKRLGVDYIDMYLVHSLSAQTWSHTKKLNTLKHLEKLRAEGKIRYIGFSFHDDFDTFKESLNFIPGTSARFSSTTWTPTSSRSERPQAGCFSWIPVVIMEPLKGGKLTDSLPPSIQNYWAQAPVQRTPAEWALRWLQISRGSHHSQRHVSMEQSKKHQCPRGCRAEQPGGKGARDHPERSGRIQQAHPVFLHRLQILHAVSGKDQHPEHHRTLQRLACL
jgi:predicted aldo/keto reductase-like oxidoreductase